MIPYKIRAERTKQHLPYMRIGKLNFTRNFVVSNFFSTLDYLFIGWHLIERKKKFELYLIFIHWNAFLSMQKFFFSAFSQGEQINPVRKLAVCSPMCQRRLRWNNFTQMKIKHSVFTMNTSLDPEN